MLSIRLDPTLAANIDKITARLHTTRSAFLKEAIIAHLEDMEDYFAAVDALEATEKIEASGQKATFTLDEINDEYAV